MNHATVEVATDVSRAAKNAAVINHLNNIPRRSITKSKLLPLNFDLCHIADNLCLI